MRAFFSFALFLFCAHQPCLALLVDNFQSGKIAPTTLGNYQTTQINLPMHSPLGGTRYVSGSSLGIAEIGIDITTSRFGFEATHSFGYFRLEYGSEAPLNVDLLADGSDAFRLRFTDTLIPAYFQNNKRGIYSFAVTDAIRSQGRSYSGEIFSVDGDGAIILPFSDFPLIDFHAVSRITVDAARIEQGSSIFINSISTIRTVPEPSAILLAGLAVVAWSTRTRFCGVQ